MEIPTTQQSGINLDLIAAIACNYLHEIDALAAFCARYLESAAIHDRGISLQLYRQFKTEEITARQIRHSMNSLPDVTGSIYWQKGGKLEKIWDKHRCEVEAYTRKQKNKHPIITQWIAWEGLPVLVHFYKYEPDPVMKLELILGRYESPTPELPLQTIATLLRCHEFLVPEYIAAALPPYTRHETKFLTIAEYLQQTMPKKLYTLQCLQRVSCHASNGVGSRDTLREHPSVPASHSAHGQTETT